MICLLDNFVFESKGVNIATIKRQSKYSFANNQPINDFSTWQSTGRHEQTINLSGTLIKYDNNALNALYAMAEMKQPVTLTMANKQSGEASQVLIQSINADQAIFLDNGEFVKQDFEVELVVIYGNL